MNGDSLRGSALFIYDQMSDMKLKMKHGKSESKLKLNLDLTELMSAAPFQSTTTNRTTDKPQQNSKRDSIPQTHLTH